MPDLKKGYKTALTLRKNYLTLLDNCLFLRYYIIGEKFFVKG